MCTCNTGWCISNNDVHICEPDRNECEGVICDSHMLCTDLFCYDNEPQCTGIVVIKFTTQLYTIYI